MRFLKLSRIVTFVIVLSLLSVPCIVKAQNQQDTRAQIDSFGAGFNNAIKNSSITANFVFLGGIPNETCVGEPYESHYKGSIVGVEIAWLFKMKNFNLGPVVGLGYWNTTETQPKRNEKHNSHGVWVPITLRPKYNFKEFMFAQRLYVWAQVDLGVALTTETGWYTDSPSGFVFKPAIGIATDINGGKSALEIGLNYLNIGGGERVNDYLGFSLGYKF